MAKLIETTCTCPICQYSFNTKKLEDMVPGEIKFDLTPYESDFLHFIVKCPNCGYASSDYSSVMDEKTINYIVNSDQYQPLVNLNWDDTYKTWMLASYVSEFNEETYDSAYECMIAAWYAKNYLKNSELFMIALNLSIVQFADFYEQTHELTTGFIILDLLRQAGRLAEAVDLSFQLIEEHELNENNNQFIEFELDRIDKFDIKEYYYFKL